MNSDWNYSLSKSKLPITGNKANKINKALFNVSAKMFSTRIGEQTLIIRILRKKTSLNKTDANVHLVHILLNTSREETLQQKLFSQNTFKGIAQ